MNRMITLAPFLKRINFISIDVTFIYHTSCNIMISPSVSTINNIPKKYIMVRRKIELFNSFILYEK